MILWKKYKIWLLKFIQLQLFVTLISLPFLVMSGLPISLMSPIGNLVYTPILTLFLFISSLIFFSELCGVPNQWLIMSLESLTRMWNYLISWGSDSWLIGFAQPPVYFFIVVIGTAFFIVHYKKLRSIAVRCICLSILLSSSLGILKYFAMSSNHVTFVPCNKGHVTVVGDNEALIVIDQGFLGQRISAPSWIEHTFLTFLYKTYGHACIDALIVMQPGIIGFEALEKLIQLAQVKRIYMVAWDGEAPSRLLQHYGGLMRACKNKGTHVIRIKKESRFEMKEISIHIEKLSHILHYQSITFPGLQISVSIPFHKDIVLRSAKLADHENIDE